MDHNEIIHALERAQQEIADLRQERDHLLPRARAYDTIERLTSLMDHRDRTMRGFGEDPVWTIERVVDQLKAEQATIEKQRATQTAMERAAKTWAEPADPAQEKAAREIEDKIREAMHGKPVTTLPAKEKADVPVDVTTIYQPEPEEYCPTAQVMEETYSLHDIDEDADKDTVEGP